jgi:hypothetical protein
MIQILSSAGFGIRSVVEPSSRGVRRGPANANILTTHGLLDHEPASRQRAVENPRD